MDFECYCFLPELILRLDNTIFFLIFQLWETTPNPRPPPAVESRYYIKVIFLYRGTILLVGGEVVCQGPKIQKKLSYLGHCQLW